SLKADSVTTSLLCWEQRFAFQSYDAQHPSWAPASRLRCGFRTLRKARSGPHFTLDDTLELILRNLKVVGCLRVQPKTCTGIKVTPKTQGRVWSNASTLVHDFRDARNRNTEIKSQLVHSDAEWHHEILSEDFARVNRWQPSRLGHTSS